MRFHFASDDSLQWRYHDAFLRYSNNIVHKIVTLRRINVFQQSLFLRTYYTNLASLTYIIWNDR